MRCQKCNSENLRKRGSYKTKKYTVPRYQCKSCGVTYTGRTNSDNYKKKRQNLENQIVEMYCERMSLRGISRVLKLNRETVTNYFLKAARKARIENLKGLHNRDFVTTYIQFDEMETFEHTKKKPLGVMLFIRAKTGEIISAKVSKSHIRALAVSPTVAKKWNSQVDKTKVIQESLFEAKKVSNRVHTTIACDGLPHQVKVAKDFCDESHINVQVLEGENKKIDLSILKLRQDISRLGRKTLSTTKKAERLQNHLDLYINYHNSNRVQIDAA